METPVIIGIAMIAAGLGIAGFIVYALVTQNRRERSKFED